VHDSDTSPIEQEALVRALAKTADARAGHGRYSEAERLYQRALALAEEVFGAQHLEVAAILTGLAALKQAQGQPLEAESLIRRASLMKDALPGV
jgi:hypothetical protein